VKKVHLTQDIFYISLQHLFKKFFTLPNI